MEGAVALIKQSDEGALVSHRFPTYVFNRDVAIPEFFKYLIPSKRLVYNLGIISPGGAGRNRVLDRNDFLDLQFVMPPVEEQKKIAEILSAWDRAIENLDKLIEAKERLKKGLMQKLLLGAVRFMEFKNVKQKAYALGASSKIISGGTPDTNNTSYWEGTTPWITSADIFGIHEITPRKHITKRAIEESATNLVPKNNVIMVTRVGLGKVAISKYDLCISQDCQGIIPNEEIFTSDFLAYYLSFVARRFIHKNQGTAIKGILKSDLEKLAITCGPLEEQKKIAKVLSCIDRDLACLNGSLEKLKSQKRGLAQKLLTGKIRVKI